MRDASGHVLLHGDGASAVTEASVEHSRAHEAGDYASESVPNHVLVRRDLENGIALKWPYGSDTLVARNGVLLPGNALSVDPPAFGAAELSVPFQSQYITGPCTRRGGGRNGAAYWSCRAAILGGTLETPWSNVAIVRRHVVPIAHEWATLDLVAGLLLTSIGASFLVPPHTRRAVGEDVAIGVGFGVPGVLALLNGVGILLRSPYDETWPTN